MYFIFFFFFKQKTAYDMRISDWSSDVCSSDLVDDATDTEKGVADTWYASAVYESKLFYGSVSYAGHEAGGLKFDGPTAAVDIIRGAEIGRASCRERVCQ